MGALTVLVVVFGLGFLASRRVGGRRQLTPRWRRLFVVGHITSSIGWFAVVVSLVALGVVGLTTPDPHTAETAYGAMLIFDDVFLGIISPIALATGVVLSVYGHWGLFRHWWVSMKLAITITLILTGVFVMHVYIGYAGAQPGVVSANLPADELQVRYVLLTGCVLSAAALFSSVLLSVFKPFGGTPWGKRRSSRRTAQPALELVVAEAIAAADGVRVLRLADRNGAALPVWQPGAHIDLVLPSGKTRQYSLIGDPNDRTSYQVAVRKQRRGRGGSREVHRLRPGESLGVNGPRGRFPLVVADSYLFLAGGIGITPLLPMIERVARAGTPWRLIYVGRSRESMPFTAYLDARYPDNVQITTSRPNLATVLNDSWPGTAVYVCGPESMITRVEELMPERCPTGSVHFERFSGAGAPQAFEVQIASTGQILDVPEGERLLDVLRGVHPKIDASCEDGYCGTCVVPVVSGTPDHRDTVSGPHNGAIYPCVSRAKGRLIVDL